MTHEQHTAIAVAIYSASMKTLRTRGLVPANWDELPETTKQDFMEVAAAAYLEVKKQGL